MIKALAGVIALLFVFTAPCLAQQQPPPDQQPHGPPAPQPPPLPPSPHTHDDEDPLEWHGLPPGLPDDFKVLEPDDVPLNEFDREPPPEPEKVPVQILPAEYPISKHVMFVVDVSGSMDMERFRDAMASVHLILGAPVDDFEAAVIAFDGGAYRWPGPTEKQPRALWGYFPGKNSFNQAVNWITSFKRNGDTNPIPAFVQAMHEWVKDMTIVLVTDGEFHGVSGKALTEVVDIKQRWRDENGLGRATIMVWATGWGDKNVHLRQIAAAGRGGMWCMREVGKPLEEDGKALEFR